MTTFPMARVRRGSAADALPLVLAVALVAMTVLVVVATGRTASPDLAQQAHDIASGLRCPVCQNLSAADSPAPMAAQMRRQISDDLRRGRSPEQIRSTFVGAYGSSVLMEPPRRGLGWLAYGLPVLVVLGAGATGVLLLRRLLRRPVHDAAAPKEERR